MVFVEAFTLVDEGGLIAKAMEEEGPPQPCLDSPGL